MSRRRRARPAWQRALFGLIVAALVFWVAELGLRLAGIEAAFSAEAIAGWRTASNMTEAPIESHGEEFRVSTNADGLRTRVPRERSTHLRVALMGDSTVFGWGADEGGTLADGLTDALNTQHAGARSFEVINAGQPGYSTFQASWLFGEVLSAYEPDLTVVIIPLHDDNLVLVSDREQIEGAGSAGASVRIALARKSRIYGLLRGVLFRTAGTPAIVPMREGSDGEPRVPRVGDEDRRIALQRMKDQAASWGGQVAVGMIPFMGDLTRRDVATRLTEDELVTAVDDLGLPMLDIRGCCGPDGGHLVLPHDQGHLTAEGNRLVGAALAPDVAELLAP